jgi:hypothetical protein
MSSTLGSVGDDWLAVVTIFAPALIPVIYAVGLWIVIRAGKGETENTGER